MMKTPKPYFRNFDGWWYVQLREDGRPRQIKLAKGKGAEAEARQRYHELMVSYRPDAPAERPIGSGTVWEVLDRYVTHAVDTLAKSSGEWHQRFLGDFAAHVGKSLTVHSLRPIHVTEWVNGHKKWSTTTKSSAFAAAKRAMRWAMMQGVIDANPLAAATGPRRTRREGTVSAEQYKTLLESIRDPRFKDYVVFLWETGCRPQELRTLEARHVELPLHRCVFPASESKGKIQPRVIYLNSTAEEIVARLALRHKSGPIFRNSVGTPWTRDTVYARFRTLKGKLGEQICAYLFRHTWATTALKQGLDAVTAGVLMGHCDPSTIGKIYQHLTEDPKYLQSQVDRIKDR